MTWTSTGLLALPLSDFLDAVAAREPAPGGGAVSAVVVGLAAALTSMTAQFSTARLPEAAAIAAEAEQLRARVAPLADRDAAAYGDVLAAFALPRDDPGRHGAVQRALGFAADVPLEIAEAGAAVVSLAGRLERAGNANLRGDAVTARVLAAAAVRSATTLVELNLSDPDEPRVRRARELADAASAFGS